MNVYGEKFAQGDADVSSCAGRTAQQGIAGADIAVRSFALDKVMPPTGTKAGAIGSLLGSATLRRGGALSANLVAQGIPLSRVDSLGKLGKDVEGALSGTAYVAGNLDDFRPDAGIVTKAEVDLSGTRVRETALPSSHLSVQLTQRMPQHFCVDHGGVGGSFYDLGEQTSKTAEIAARIFSGEKAENIPLVHDSGTRVNVDWRELVQWDVPESALPPGTIVLFRQPSVWGRYRKYILAGVAVIILQTLLITGLLWQRARRQKTELTLRESEKRFQVMADTTPSLVWMCDREGNVVYLNDRRIRFTGRDPKGGFGDAWTSFIHPDDRERVQIANRRALEQKEHFSKEYRLRRQDGEYRWMLDVAAPRINGDGRFAGFVGAAVDVTDQKLAQDALEKVSGKLIEAQEAERDRIARDLHDDFSQRLAVQCIELTQLRNDLPESEVDARTGRWKC